MANIVNGGFVSANILYCTYCDNQATIRLAENLMIHARIKHIEVHHHFLREKVLEEKTMMRPIGTKE